jgi:hypothetical protein
MLYECWQRLQSGDVTMFHGASEAMKIATDYPGD